MTPVAGEAMTAEAMTGEAMTAEAMTSVRDVEPIDYTAVIRDESETFVAAVEAAGFDVLVPTCPGWTVRDLVTHLGTTQRWAAANVERRPDRSRIREVGAPPEAREDAIAWMRDGTATLVAAIEAAPRDDPVWSWAGDGATVGFWARRMALETAVHRYDAQVSAGWDADVTTSMPTSLAVDGVDEFLTVFAVSRPGGAPAGEGETVHLHATDAEGEWLVRLAPNGPEVERAHAKGDVAARGPASALLLYAWGRTDAGDLEVFGDAALLERFVASVRV